MDAASASVLDIDPAIAHAIGVRAAVRLPPLRLIAAGEPLGDRARPVVAAAHLWCAGALFGPGDILAAAGGLTAAAGARIALLERDAPGLAERAARQASRRRALRGAIRGAPAPEALLALLWWAAERWGRPDADGVVLELALGADALAAVLQQPPETLAPALAALQGAVECSGGTWRLASPRSRRDALRLRAVRQLALARAAQRDFLAALGQLAE